MTATTGADRTYVIEDLQPATHTVTPQYTGYTFDPAVQQVVVSASEGDATGVDFTGTVGAGIESKAQQRPVLVADS